MLKNEIIEKLVEHNNALKRIEIFAIKNKKQKIIKHEENINKIVYILNYFKESYVVFYNNLL